MTRNSGRATFKKDLGEKLRDRRLTLEMSQEELASKADIPRTLISTLERGMANPTLDSMMKISDALRVSLRDLF